MKGLQLTGIIWGLMITMNLSQNIHADDLVQHAEASEVLFESASEDLSTSKLELLIQNEEQRASLNREFVLQDSDSLSRPRFGHDELEPE